MKRYKKAKKKSPTARLRYPLTKSISLIGLMGSGKTTVGTRLARKLGIALLILMLKLNSPPIIPLVKYLRNSVKKISETVNAKLLNV